MRLKSIAQHTHDIAQHTWDIAQDTMSLKPAARMLRVSGVGALKETNKK